MIDLQGHGAADPRPAQAAGDLRHPGDGRAIQGLRNLQPRGQVEFLPEQGFRLALGHRALQGKGAGALLQPFHPRNARKGGHRLGGKHPAPGLQYGPQPQAPAVSGGFHVLHGGIPPAEHPGLGAGQIKGMGEVRAGLHGLGLVRVALGVQGVEHHPALQDYLILLGLHVFQHHHGAGGEHPRFLPESAGQGDFPFHGRLALGVAHQALHLQILPKAFHFHKVLSPLRWSFAKAYA